VASAIATETAAPATAVTLTKADVIGDYKGSAVVTGLGTTIPLKLVIRSTSATLTVTGYGTVTIALSTHKFNALRDGNFSLAWTFDTTTFDLVGSVIKSGTRITGTFTGTGAEPFSGTFLLKKY
jgi:hypothetical protein